MAARTACPDDGEVLHPSRRRALVAAAVVAASTLTLVVPRVASADTPTGLDAGYGDGGKAIVPLPDGEQAFSLASAVDAQGRAVVLFAGHDEGIARFTAAGHLDSTFGANGIVSYPTGFEPEEDLQVGAQGITIAGESATGPAVLRLHDDGSPVTAANPDGVVAFDAGDLQDPVALAATTAADGSVYAAVSAGRSGDHYFVEHRLASGAVAAGFGTGGSVRFDAAAGRSSFSEDLLIDHLGRVLVVQNDIGSDVADEDAHLRRLRADGTGDPTFATSGVLELAGAAVTGLAEDPHDGSLVAFGVTPSDDGCCPSAVFRITSAGQLDRAFGTDGRAHAAPSSMPTTVAWSGVVLASGQIGVVSETTPGTTQSLAVSVLQPDGSFDTSFGTGGVLADPRRAIWSGVGEGADGQLLVTSTGPTDPDSGLLAPPSVWAYTIGQTDPLPHVTHVVARPKALTATWTTPSDPPFGTPRAYLAMALDGSNHVAGQTVVPADVTTASITGLVNGTTYRVVVLPYSDAGAGWTSAPVTGTPSASRPAITTAGAVGNLTAANGDGFLTLGWTPPTDDGGSPIAGYSVLAVRKDTGALAGWRNLPTDVRSASLSGLTDGVAYDAYVLPYTAEGFGASATITRIPVATLTAQGPAISWVAAVRVGSSAVVSFGPAVEHGDPLTKWNVVVLQGGAMKAWKVLGPNARQTTVPLASTGNAQVYVFAQGAGGYGPLPAPVTVAP